MIQLSALVEFLDNYLSIKTVSDNSWNGLQATGRSTVQTIALAVDASMETFKGAAEEKADILIAHHGHFWRTVNPSLITWKHERLKVLLDHDISLYAAHLPLDRHEEVGNNAQLLKLLGAKITDKFIETDGINFSWIGELSTPKTLTEIEKLLNKELDTKCIVLPFGAKEITKVAVCSGSGGYPAFYEALEKNVDLYLTGEVTEVYQTAKDAGMNVVFAGHYATETVGLKALGKVLEQKYNVKTVFIDSPTGL